MRLDFRNIGRGLEAIAEAKQARDLAQESARYDVTEGAYGPGLQENIQQIEALKAQDPTQAPAYDQAIAELTRRQGLTAPDYSVASGPTNFATRQEARQAAAPLRAEGLASVYRRYGDVAKADVLEARAYEQQRAIAAERRAAAGEERAVARETREVAGEERTGQEFATRQTETGLRINELTRIDAERRRETDFQAYAAERPNATVAELKEAAFKEFKFSPKQWQAVVNTRLGIEETDQKLFTANVKKKLQGRNLSQVGELYNTDPAFDDKTDLAIVPGKNGAVTLNFIDKGSKTVTESQTFKNQALALEYLNKQATEPETIGSWMMNLRKAESAIEAQGAATRASEATVGLRGAQMRQISESAASAEARAILQDRFDALTDAQKNGPEGDAIVRQFNLLNVKAGGQVALRAPAKAAGPVRMDDVDKENLRAYREWENLPRNARLPQGQKDAYAARLGVLQFVNRAAPGPDTGLGSNPFAASAASAPALARTPAAPIPAPAPAPAPLTSANLRILSAAGRTGYNVELPDGTTRVMSVKELEKAGYRFPAGLR